jgi:ribosome-binding factor A
MPREGGASSSPGKTYRTEYWIIRFSRMMTTDGISRKMPRHHNKDSAPGGSQRQLRVGETVRHAIADVLSHGSVHDAALEGHIITVPEVRMSPDLKLATIYVMPLGGRDADAVIAALERNKKFLRGEIARRVNLKFAPDIRFRVDERFDEAERIEKLLRTPAVQRDLAPDSPDSEE